MDWFIEGFIDWFMVWFIDWFIDWFMDWYIAWFIRLILWSIHGFIHGFIHWFNHCFIQSLRLEKNTIFLEYFSLWRWKTLVFSTILASDSINQSSHPWMKNRIFAAEVSQNTKNAFLRWRERWKSVLPTLGGSVIFAVCDTSAARIPSPKQSFQSRGVAKVPNFASHARREHWKNYASCLARGSFFVLLRHLSSKNAKRAGNIA